MTNHPPLGLVDVFVSTLPKLKFKPGVHVNYAETVLPMKDGLPKIVRNARVFLDVQKEFGSFDKYVWRFVDGRHVANRPDA